MPPVIEKQPGHPSAIPSLQQRKQQFARDAIWDAAIDLFSEKGYDETTVEEIAAKAGASRRSFFRHFDSKSDLLAQPVLDWGTALVEAVRDAPATLSNAELLREIVSTVAVQSAASPRTWKILAIAARYPAAQEAQLSCVVSVQQRLIEALSKRGITRMQAHLLSGVVFAVLSTAHFTSFEESEPNISLVLRSVLERLTSIASPIPTTTKQSLGRRK